MRLVLILLTLLITPCYAAEVKDLSIEFLQYFPGGRAPLITDNGLGRNLDKTLNLNLNIDLMETIYWNNVIHASTDSTKESAGQFRSVGWLFEVGVRVSKDLDIFYNHHSQHVLDTTYQPGFPVQDAVGFRLNLINRSRGGTIWP